MKLSGFSKKMIIAFIVAGVLITAFGGVFYLLTLRVNGEIYYTLTFWRTLGFGLGVAIGTAANIIKLFLLERSVHKIQQIENPLKAKSTAQVQHLLRFALTGASLVLAALLPLVSLWGAIFGILTAPILLHTVSLLKRKELTAGGDEL